MAQPTDTKTVVFNDPNVKPVDLIEIYARKHGEQFAREEKGSRTQLRRFYQEYQSLRERIETQEEYERYAPKVKMMLSKAAYAWRGGSDSKIPRSFHEWLTRNVKAIRSAEDVRVFGDYFEAVVGYYYGTGSSKGGGGGTR